MRIQFREEERSYILDNPETDLLLTEIGLSLVEEFSVSDGVISVEATEAETQEFLAELRYAFIWKLQRVAEPVILRGLARRLLPDYNDIAPPTDC